MTELHGTHVILRNIAEADLAALWQMIYGDESPEWKKWDAPYYPLERIDLKLYRQQMSERLTADGGVPSRLAITTRDGDIIGTVSYYWEHQPSLWMEVGIVIYKPAYWNGGYGTEALKLWVDHLFASMPLVRIGLATWSGNRRMIRCAEKLGMQMEARIRKARLYDGNYYDSIRMGVLREEWESNDRHIGKSVIETSIHGFSHVTIDVSDMEASLRFYVDILGLRLVHRGRRDAYLEWGTAWVCLQERPELPAQQQQLGVDHVALYIAPDAFHSMVDRLRVAHVHIVRGPVERGGGWTVNFLDPDGTQLEFHTGTLAERMKVWK